MKFFERRSYFMRKTINSKRTVAYFQRAGPAILPGILEGSCSSFWRGES